LKIPISNIFLQAIEKKVAKSAVGNSKQISNADDEKKPIKNENSNNQNTTTTTTTTAATTQSPVKS
jgi:hypothetical protein